MHPRVGRSAERIERVRQLVSVRTRILRAPRVPAYVGLSRVRARRSGYDDRMDDARFLDAVADRLASLPAVEAVSLGGSRAQGTERPDSDWDLAVYYRGAFRPQALRDLGWPGEVSEIGGWGGGVFNGGAWLTIDGRAVDVHYRDLDVIEHELGEAEAGRFRIEPLLFHLALIPSYLVVGELAINRVLRGSLPRPHYPDALRRAAADEWSGRAEITAAYAERNHAAHGRVTACAGLLATVGDAVRARGDGRPGRVGHQREDPARPCGHAARSTTSSWN